MVKALKYSWRLIRVALILARFRALFFLDLVKDKKPAIGTLKTFLYLFTPRKAGTRKLSDGQRLVMALTRLGPAYIKLGQTLATRPDMIGDEMAGDLSSLQDRLPAIAFKNIKTPLENALGGALEDFYQWFEEDAVAAASIAQVHKAKTTEGVMVAVKILRPGIRVAMARDIEAFHYFAKLIQKHVPQARRLQPRRVVALMERTIREELNLALEGKAADELRHNMQDQQGYRVPSIDWLRTGPDVLTLEWIDGIPLRNHQALEAAGHNRKSLSERVITVFLTQAIRDGFFHGDLHQGNYFVEPDGTLVPIDFGIMGRLNEETREYLAKILWGFQQQDYYKVADIHFEAGYVPRDQDRDAFAEALRKISEPIFQKAIEDISFGDLMRNLMATTERFQMQTQPQLLILQRTMVMAEGIALHLDRQANMWELSRPTLKAWVMTQLKKDNPLFWFIQMLFDLLTNLAQMMPDFVQKLLAHLIDFLKKMVPSPTAPA